MARSLQYKYVNNKSDIMNKYYLVTFDITDKKYVSPYIRERKKVYFTALNEKDVDDYIKRHSLHGGGVYNYTITPCKEEDLKGLYPTDGFYCVIIPKDDVLGKLDITEREWLVEWQKMEHDGEYARVLRRQNFIVMARDGKTAGTMAEEYAFSRRYAYRDEYITYLVSDDVNAIDKVKKNGNFVMV